MAGLIQSVDSMNRTKDMNRPKNDLPLARGDYDAVFRLELKHQPLAWQLSNLNTTLALSWALKVIYSISSSLDLMPVHPSIWDLPASIIA